MTHKSTPEWLAPDYSILFESIFLELTKMINETWEEKRDWTKMLSWPQPVVWLTSCTVYVFQTLSVVTYNTHTHKVEVGVTCTLSIGYSSFVLKQYLICNVKHIIFISLCIENVYDRSAGFLCLHFFIFFWGSMFTMQMFTEQFTSTSTSFRNCAKII